MNKESALKYARAGFKLFPLWWINENGACACGDENCGKPGSDNNPGKHPIAGKPGNWIAPKGRLDSTSDIAKIEKWFNQYPQANIGLDCSANGIFVIDIDRHTVRGVDINGFESVDDWETTFADKIDSNVSAETGGGGLHLLYKAPSDFTSSPSGLGKNYPGIDFKFNGYIILSPSNHKSGNKYAWTEGSEKDFLSRKFPPLPASIENFIRSGHDENRFSPERYTAASRDVDSDDLDQIRDALSCLIFGSLNDDERLKVGMGLQHLLPGGMGKELYFDWVRGGVPKFNYKLTERRWRSFKYRSGGRTIASFFELAMEFGFENTGKQGVFIDPEDHIIMEPFKIMETHNLDYDTIFVDDSVPVPMFVDDDVLPTMYPVDYDIEPSMGNYDLTFMFLQAFGYEKFMVKEKEEETHAPVNFGFIPSAQVFHAESNDFLQVEERKQSEIDKLMNNKNASPAMRLLQKAVTSGKDLSAGAGMPTNQEMKAWTDRLGNRQVLCDLFRWQVENSSAYVPELSAAFTLSVLGALMAGRFEYNGLTTNLYFMVIANTSVGKTQTVKLAKKVMESAFDQKRIGPKDIISDKGFYQDMAIDKGRYFMLDEIGELFANIFNERSNSSQKLIKRSILDGYTAYAEKTNVTASKADAKNNPIIDLGGICPSIFGLTTPGQIFEALSGKDIIDGLLSRLQILQSEDEAKEGKIAMETSIPNSVGAWIHRLRSVYAPGMYVEGSDVVTRMDASKEAKFMISKVKEVENTKKKSAGKYAGIWGRLTENTIRVAMIFEIAERPDSKEIQTESVVLAYDFVNWCSEKSEALARNFIADSKEQSLMKEVHMYVKTMPFGARIQDIAENTKIGADVRNRRLIMQTLKAEQKIREFEYKDRLGTRGRGTMLYFDSDDFEDFKDSAKGKKFLETAKER